MNKLISQHVENDGNNLTFTLSFQNFVNEKTQNFEIEFLAEEVQSLVKNHLFALRAEKIKSQNNQSFSNFGTRKTTHGFSSLQQQTPAPQPIPVKTIHDQIAELSLSDVIRALQKLSAMSSVFTDMYSFNGSSYSYTITSNSWSSPFGTQGTQASELLNDLVTHLKLHEMRYQSVNDFFQSVLDNKSYY